MTQQKRISRRREPEETNAVSASDGGGAELLPQVEGWGAAAREARESCATGEDAVEKLRTRKNVSGE